MQRGGIDVQRDCRRYIKSNGPLTPGSVVVTKTGTLKCDHLMHAVGPIWYDGSRDEHEILKSTVNAVLDEATRLNVKSIAIPAISTGIFMFPREQAA